MEWRYKFRKKSLYCINRLLTFLTWKIISITHMPTHTLRHRHLHLTNIIACTGRAQSDTPLFLNYNLKTHHPVILSRLQGKDFLHRKENAGVSKDAAHCILHTLMK